MKVVHVVTLVSPDGAYGGPTRVALNQAGALIERGHDVTVVGAHRGYDRPPTQEQGVPLRLFPARRAIPYTGFAGLSSPAMLWWACRNLRGYDLVHVHLARDLVTMPVAMLALRLGVPLVLQTHGMVVRPSRLSARVLDVLATRRVLRRAKRVFHLTPAEREELAAVAGPSARLTHLPNGVPATTVRAHGDSEVLFLARLAERKRPMHFARAAVELHRDWPQITFAMVGPDEGELDELEGFIESSDAADYLSYEGPVNPRESLDRMSRAAVYVLPSVDEPFPMSVLEAMSIGLPVIVTDTSGLADVVTASGSGMVTDGTVDQLVTALTAYLDDADRRRIAGESGRQTTRARFDMSAIGDQLLSTYSDAVSADGPA